MTAKMMTTPMVTIDGNMALLQDRPFLPVS
jgi:hypothetical protein